MPNSFTLCRILEGIAGVLCTCLRKVFVWHKAPFAAHDDMVDLRRIKLEATRTRRDTCKACLEEDDFVSYHYGDKDSDSDYLHSDRMHSFPSHYIAEEAHLPYVDFIHF